ncbi:MAG: cytosolic protein [candidate division KSB1 bacterium]
MDQDSAWKEVLENLFEDFLSFFFPELHQDIDFSKPPEFLDNELQQIAVESETGKRVVDKLAKVYLRNGSEKWLLIHLEIQGYQDKNFPERMYVYNYRAFDKFHWDVISLAVLTDDNAKFRPNEYVRSGWGFEVVCRYPLVKLIDYRARMAELEANPHPFAIIVRAYLQTLETENNFQERYSWKKRFLLELYASGIERETIWVIYKFVDWMMKLPEELETELVVEMKKTKEAKAMSELTTSIERYAMRKGHDSGLAKGKAEGKAEGLAQSLAVILEIKFGEAGKGLTHRVQQTQRTEVLQKFLVDLMHASSLAEAETKFAALEQQAL